ncbi:cellulose binding domain-containing protein [Catellatospora tritici]|uniref:cellulose binding domain-containing protein n=1 Tax=Catellatospora tritici TaxID=2851566 RepID=UPI001C2DB06D|nr:cellulose binding domain-containing protein [Catellatospora tritici]MBV1852990.1 cellulose binding domain-containing protein [Catellatospora tritici]
MSWPKLRAALIALLTTVASATALLVLSPSTPAAAAAVRIMPLGDSITGSPGCWRALLWNRLQSAGYTNIDFVGTLGPQGCGVAYDGDNEGHGGYLVTNVADQNQLVPWLAATLPDIVVMHFGTNDVWSNRAPSVILAAYSKLVDQMRAGNPNMKVLVAKIIPVNPPSCPECAQRTIDLNNAIPAWAAGKTTAQSPITVVDQWTGFNTATDTGDGVHPNAAGDQKMSDRWYPALAAAIGGTTPSPSASASPSPSRSPSPTPSINLSLSPSPTRASSPPPATKSCSATFTVTNQWNNGFQGDITVKNTGTVTLTGWIVKLVFPNGQVITQGWNGTFSQSGATATVTNVAWNGTLAPGATASAGFLASWSGINGPPAVTCTPL